MKRIGVLYATREGHSRKIAERVGQILERRGMQADVVNVRKESAAIDLSRYHGVLLAASLHGGKYESEMVAFVKTNHKKLNALPSAFLPVSLSEAGAELPSASTEARSIAAAGVQKTIYLFCAYTGWHPEHVKPIAGALMYSKYNVLLRWVMKRIAKKSGGDTDTSRDYDYTNWAALEEFVEQFAAELPSPWSRSEIPALS
jgi:menaquinone-dependent protoporphyrinogen oxidase